MKGLSEDNFYCAGHSLGAHVCAFAGKWTREKFGFTINRITGLDAAGPLFEKMEGVVGKFCVVSNNIEVPTCSILVFCIEYFNHYKHPHGWTILTLVSSILCIQMELKVL